MNSKPQSKNDGHASKALHRSIGIRHISAIFYQKVLVSDQLVKSIIVVSLLCHCLHLSLSLSVVAVAVVVAAVEQTLSTGLPVIQGT